MLSPLRESMFSPLRLAASPEPHATYSSTSTPASPAIQHAPPPRVRVWRQPASPRPVHPDIALQAVHPNVEKKVYESSRGKDTQPRPSDYAVKMLLLMVDFVTFTRMATTVSWKGGEGKQALPENLITELKKHVGTRFGDILVQLVGNKFVI